MFSGFAKIFLFDTIEGEGRRDGREIKKREVGVWV